MDALTERKERLKRAREALSERKGQQKRLQQERDRCAAELERCREQADIFEQVIVLLQAIFGPDYAFRIQLTEKAGRAEAEFYVTSRYGTEVLETRPQDSRGGGVVDVVCLGLRIAMLETYRPRLQGALILDEPAKHVSDDFIQPTAQFLKMVSQFFGRQVIMVTHNPHLAETAEVAYQVTLRDGISQVSRLG